MNKYKSALSDILCYVPFGKLKEQEKILQELVEKATSKKIEEKTEIIEGYSFTNAVCPSCKEYINEFEYYAYCPHCGQALDWSEDDE